MNLKVRVNVKQGAVTGCSLSAGVYINGIYSLIFRNVQQLQLMLSSELTFRLCIVDLHAQSWLSRSAAVNLVPCGLTRKQPIRGHDLCHCQRGCCSASEWHSAQRDRGGLSLSDSDVQCQLNSSSKTHWL